MGLNEALSGLFAQHADRPALLSQDSQVLTFGKLERTVATLAARLEAEGVRPGQCVAVLTDNRVLRIALFLALARLGAEVALVASTAPLAARGQRVDWAIRFADQSAEGAARELVVAQDWLDTPAGPAPETREPGALILATSGSTGMPRFVRVRPEVYFNMPATHGDGAGESLGPVLVSIPEIAPFTIYLLMRAFRAGHGMIGMKPAGAQTLADAGAFGVREMMLTPHALNELVAAAEGGAPRGTLARIAVFGAVAEPALLRRAEAVFGCPVVIINGATEIGQTSFGRFDPATYRTGWSGWPLRKIEVRIGTGEPAGTSGRLYLRAPPGDRVEGYLGGPPAYDEEGWFDTGDVARILPDGVLLVEGRADNLINLGGAKYAAELVEMLAGQCPGVALSAATRLDPLGAGAPELGLAVVAGPDLDAEQVRLFLAAKLHSSVPIRVVTVAGLPHLPSGKLDRRALPALFA
jgi:acyl-coenzyme A synthetase/AMP-(fatty) acid ligase